MGLQNTDHQAQASPKQAACFSDVDMMGQIFIVDSPFLVRKLHGNTQLTDHLTICSYLHNLSR
jgi:hypothetical protein